MTALDIIVLLLVGLGLWTGIRKGLTYSVLSLGVWVLVVLALWLLHGPLARVLEGAMAASGAYMLAFVLIVIITLVGGKLIVGRMSRGVRGSRVGSADRLLGAGFGALKGLVYATLFYMAGSFVYDTIWGRTAQRPAWVRDAVTRPLIDGMARTFVDLSERRQQSLEAEAGSNKAATKTK